MTRALSRRKAWVAIALLGGAMLAASCSSSAPGERTGTVSQAETPDTFGIGSGRDGNAAVAAAGTVLNSYAAITAVSAPVATQVTIGAVHGAAAGFVADDLVLVWHTTGLAAATSGTQTSIALIGDVGAYELARVKSATPTTLTLTNPLSSAARFATASQVVRVPEYQTLTINAGASVAAYPWDGSSGGVVVLFATVAIANGGAIQADAAGFRGGGVENAAVQPGCVSLDDWSNAIPIATCGGAHKGEGLLPTAYAVANPAAPGAGPAATYGRGNYANGGGGGDAHNAGGGGGGNAGVGGLGGRTWIGDLTAGIPRSVGGLGGAPVTYAFASYLAAGGGGGAGEENDMVGTAGGNGGGVVLLRAASLTGGGTVSAAGGSVTTAAGNDGCGGGGAGGAVVIQVSGAAACGQASANGGQGGSGGTDPDGPGGGGAGGYVLVTAASGVCPVKATAGANGTTPTANALGPTYGATAGAAGIATPAAGTGFAGPVCTSTVLSANHCGGCVLNVDCPGTQPICDSASNMCAPCNGAFGSGATHACPTSASGVCVTANVGTDTDAGVGSCVACVSSLDCANPTPVCSNGTCSACNGDNGSTATSICPVGSPFCNTTSGACGSTCFTDAECGTGSWCNNLADAGACQLKVPNGQPVPGGTCVVPVAMRACVSTICDAASATCVAPASDAGPDGSADDASDAEASTDDASDGATSDATTSDASLDGGAADAADASGGDAEGGALIDASDASLDAFATDASPGAPEAEAADDASDAGAEPSDVVDADDAGSGDDVGTPPASTGGTIEGGGLSCSMSASPVSPGNGWMALNTMLGMLGVCLLRGARRRRLDR